MSGDLQKYRRNAARCVALANATRDELLKNKLIDIATTWEKLAEKLERTQTIGDGSIQHADRRGAKN